MKFLTENRQVSLAAKIAALLLACALPLSAQYTTATLVGTVRDPSGAVVPEATVKVQNTATGFTQASTTSSTGAFIFARLPVGNYTLRVAKPGFNGYVQSGIVLAVNQTATQDVTLRIGAVAQQVTVSGNASLVTTSSATVSQLVNTAQVVDLPLDTREVQSLVFLAAGATNATSHYCGYGCIGGTFPGEQYAKVNGTVSNSVNYQLDGGNFNNVLINTNLPFPDPDAIQEFSLQTDNMSAAYGNAAGGVVNIVTKSGTNQTHGDAFEFLRNGPLFDARNFFAPAVDAEKQNQFGGTIGGPVRKDDLFYFASYQGTRLHTAPQGQVAFVPTATERTGDFSDLLPGTQLINPVTGAPFPGNIIPAIDLSSVAQHFLPYVPAPTGPGGELTYVGPASVQDADEGLMKLDYQRGNNHLSGHYFLTRIEQPAFSSPTNLLENQGGSILKAENIAFNDTYNVTSNLLLNTWYSLNYEHGQSLIAAAPFGFPEAGVNVAPSPGNVPELVVNVGGAFTINTGDYGDFTREINTASENVTWIKGAHEVQFGGLWSFVHAPKAIEYQTGGEFDFVSALSGSDTADFMLGRATDFTQSGGIFYDLDETRWGAFIQDDWRARSNLTLSMGLRWDPFLPYTDSEGRLGCFEPGKQSVRYPNAPTGLLYGGTDHDPGCPPGSNYSNLANIEPRLGFAYRITPDGKTSVRGGAGLYTYIPNLVAYQDVSSIPPFAPTYTVTDVSFADPYGSVGIADPFPAAFGPRIPGSDATFTTPIALPQILAQNLRSPQIAAWNLTFERQLGQNWLSRVAYAGNKGTYLYGTGDQELGEQEVNPAIYIPGQSTVANEQQRRPFPNFSDVGVITPAINSNYNALQLTLESRPSHGFSVLANYTWSKELDDFAPIGAVGSNTDPFDRKFDYGQSDDDLTNAIKLSAVYRLPSFRQNGWISGFTQGWILSSILTWQSGFPFSIFSGFDNSLTGVGNDRADFVGTSLSEAELNPNRSHGALVQEYFNTTAFAPNAIGTFGNTGKNFLRGPGLFDDDIALMKNTRLTERTALQLRFETFNLFNSVNFLNPQTILNAPGFGQLTSAGSPRILQFAVKIRF